MKKHLLFLLFAAITFLSASATAPPMPSTDTASVSLQVGGNTKFGTINVIDSTTGNFLTATISSIVIQNNNPEIATVSQNNATSVKAVAVSAGTGTAIVSCNISYVDPGDGLQKNQTKSAVVSYTVTGTPHGAGLTLQF